MHAATGIFPDQTTPAINADLDHLQAIGVTTLWIVLDVSWAFPSTTTIDSGVAAKYDACINGANSRGMTVAVQAHGNPSWIVTAGGHTPNVWHGPDNVSERGNWTTCLHNFINRYGATKIQWVEIWNEPHLLEFWVQGWNVLQYTQLLHDCYVDIKGTWPTIKVVGHNMARSDIGWLQQSYAWSDITYTAPTSAANNYWFDVLGIHPYCGNSTSGYDPADTSHADETTDYGTLGTDFLDYRRLRTEILSKEGFNKPLAFGEFGYATLGTGWFKVTEAQRAVYVTTAMGLAAADGYVEYFALFYHWTTETPSNYATSFNFHGSSLTEAAFAAAAGISSAARSWLILVEVAFASQPMAAPSWTDITAYVLGREGITRTWGRTDEFSEVQPSTLTLTLNNRDGRFTRGLTSSPYYPNVRNGRRIRVSVVRNAVTYRRFDGHVNEWPTQWVGGGSRYAEAVITATDRLKRLSAKGELRSMVEEEILRDAGTAAAVYYPLSEPAGSSSAASITKTGQGPAAVTIVGTGDGAGTDPALAFGQGTGPGTDDLPAPIFLPTDAANGRYLNAALYTPVGVAGVTLEAWFRADAFTSRTIASLEDNFGTRLRLGIDGTGKLTGLYNTPKVTPYTLTSAGAVNDAKTTHHAAITESLSGSTVTARLYLDGVQVDTATRIAFGMGSYSKLRIGGRGKDQLFSGTLSHVAALNSTLAAGRIADHFNAGDNGLAGERSDQRIARIADWVAIPSADRALDVGDSLVGAQNTSGKQPVEAIQEVAAAESGVAYADGTGSLVFHNRSRRYNLTPAVTLTAAQILDALEFPGDDFGLTNDMAVSRPGGAQARSVSQSSIDEYGLYRDSKEIVAYSDTDTQAIADWRVQSYAEPKTRTPNVTVDLVRLEQIASSQVALLLAADISTKLRLSTLPSQAPASTVDVFVEGGTETFTRWFWRIVFNTSPADPYQVWQLGITGFTELDLTTRLGL